MEIVCPLCWEDGETNKIKGWYKAATNRAPSPTQPTMNKITAEQVALYQRVPPSGEKIRVCIAPLPIVDLLPDKEEVE